MCHRQERGDPMAVRGALGATGPAGRHAKCTEKGAADPVTHVQGTRLRE